MHCMSGLCVRSAILQPRFDWNSSTAHSPSSNKSGLKRQNASVLRWERLKAVACSRQLDNTGAWGGIVSLREEQGYPAAVLMVALKGVYYIDCEVSPSQSWISLLVQYASFRSRTEKASYATGNLMQLYINCASSCQVYAGHV